jgi:cytochrome c oxidase subunit 3
LLCTSAIETRGSFTSVDKEGHRVALADFAVNLYEEREQLTQIRQSGLWAKVL